MRIGDWSSDVCASDLWVYRVRQLAKEMEVEPYSPDKLRALLPKLRSLMIDPESVASVPALLAECGVRFVIVEVLPNAKISGVCTWVDDETQDRKSIV